MLGISGRIDFYTIAIHEAIASFAHAVIADQFFGTPMIAGAAVIDIRTRIFGNTRTIGYACTWYTGVIFANQAVFTSVSAAAAIIDRSCDNFITIAIGVSISYFAFAIVAD